jgi:molecular chaperone GrpE
MTKKIKNPRSKVGINTTKLEKEVKDLENKFKRALADYQNQSKRHETRQVEIVKFANQDLLDKLLPVLDSLELAQHHLKDAGLNMVIDQFNKLLISEEVLEMDSTSQEFDPQTMDCASLVEGPKDIAINTLVKGYTYYDKILRPAKVEVGIGSSKK